MTNFARFLRGSLVVCCTLETFVDLGQEDDYDNKVGPHCINIKLTQDQWRCQQGEEWRGNQGREELWWVERWRLGKHRFPPTALGMKM